MLHRGWIIVVMSAIIVYYSLHTLTPPPGNMSPAEYKATIEMYQAAAGVMRDSVSFTFDWAVTKTALPVLTLLLGYLFGSKKN